MPSRFPVLRGADPQQSRLQDSIQNILQPVAEALQATPIMGAPPPPEIRPTLLNGFGAPPTAAFVAVSYHRDALGYVHVRGASAHAAGAGALTTMFILPLGYRPRNTRQIVISGSAAVAQAVWVLPTGEVQTRLAVVAGTTVYPEFSFLAEQ